VTKLLAAMIVALSIVMLINHPGSTDWENFWYPIAILVGALCYLSYRE